MKLQRAMYEHVVSRNETSYIGFEKYFSILRRNKTKNWKNNL